MGRAANPSGRVLLAIALAATLLPLAAGRASAASILRVKVNATGANNGATWADAYTSLQTALGAATSGDQIWVAKGTYVPTTNTDASVSFALKSGVAVYGGFAGNETSASKRNPSANLTILSGDIGVQGTNADNSRHVVTAWFVNSATILDGFKVIGGYNFTDIVPGSGILVSGGSPTLRNLIVSGGVGFAGGGIGVDNGGSPLIERVLLTANFAGGGYGLGGGMQVSSGSPTLRNVTFASNSGNFGAGLETASGTSPNLINVTFSGNTLTSGTSGGAIYSDGNLTLSNSIVWGNASTEVIAASGTMGISNSIVAGGCPASASCTAVADADPKLGTLKANGAFVPTLAPGAGSAAIDGGANGTCAATDARGVTRPQGPSCDMGAVEVRVLSFRSQAAYDGWILESSETSSKGGIVSATATTIRIGDDAKNRQYRGIVSFNTASLPDSATIVRTTLRLKPAGIGGTSPLTTHGTLAADIRSPRFGTSASLATSDFSAAASRNAAASFGSAAVGGWYVASVGTPGLAFVSRTATTQFRLRFTLDDNNDRGADYLSVASGNASTSASRPLLQVYYLP